MEQILVLLNPLAGTKKAAPVLASILDIFCKAGFAPIVRTTQGPGDGTRIVREYGNAANRSNSSCQTGNTDNGETISSRLMSPNWYK